MDYSERVYYLIRVDYTQYDRVHTELKKLCPSIKFHPPYGHYRVPEWKRNYDPYDGVNIPDIDGSSVCWQEMVSVRYSDWDKFEMYTKILLDIYPEYNRCKKIGIFELNQ